MCEENEKVRREARRWMWLEADEAAKFSVRVRGSDIVEAQVAEEGAGGAGAGAEGGCKKRLVSQAAIGGKGANEDLFV